MPKEAFQPEPKKTESTPIKPGFIEGTSPVKVESNIDSTAGLGNQSTMEAIEADGTRPGPKIEDEKVAPDFAESLSPENKGFFSRLASGPMQLARWTYEKTLGKAVGKAKILYHEYWMNRHQGKAEVLKGKILDTNAKIAQAEKSHAEISKALKELGALNSPNLKSFEERLRMIESEKGKLEVSRTGFEKSYSTGMKK